MTMAENSPIQLDDDIINDLETQIADEIFVARGSMEPAITEIIENREYLNNTSKRYDVPFEGACELVAPFVKESLFALQAEISPTLMNPQPFLRFGFKGMDQQVAAILQMMGIEPDMSRLWETCMQALVFEEMRARLIFDAWIYASLRDSVSIMFNSWDTQLRNVPAWETRITQTIDPATGMTLGKSMRRRRTKMQKTVYDYPRCQIIPIENFLVYPAIDADIQYSELVGASYNVTGDDLAQGLALGEYDEVAVRKVLQYDEDNSDVKSAEDTRFEVQGQSVPGKHTRRPLTIFEGVKRLPEKDIDEPGVEYWITYHERSNTIMRATPLEEVFWHGKRPFVACRPYANIQGLFADSVITSGAGFVQDAKTTLFRLAVDATALGIAPPMLVAMSLYKKAEEQIAENRRPFGVMPFPDQYFNTGGKLMQPFAPGINPANIIPIAEMLDVEGQKGTTATDSLKSMPTPNQITATQSAQIFESSKVLTGHLIEHCAAAVDEVGQQLYELVKQYSDHESISTLWARTNAESEVPFEIAVQGDYYVSANGVSETANRQILSQRAIEQLTLIRSDETAWSVPENRYNSLREALVKMGCQNIEDRIGTLQDYLMRSQQNEALMLMQSMSGAMEGGGGNGGGSEPKALPGPGGAND